MRILDATASVRSIWYQKENDFTVFMDKRCERTTQMIKGCKKQNMRSVNINPNIIAVWQKLPFLDNVFDMVIFDPPHLFERAHNPSIVVKYGVLNKNTWKEDIRIAGSELFRVLKENGFLVLKWNEGNIKVDKIIDLMPFNPLFGSKTGTKNNTHWIVFIKQKSKIPELETFL